MVGAVDTRENNEDCGVLGNMEWIEGYEDEEAVGLFLPAGFEEVILLWTEEAAERGWEGTESNFIEEREGGRGGGCWRDGERGPTWECRDVCLVAARIIFQGGV